MNDLTGGVTGLGRRHRRPSARRRSPVSAGRRGRAGRDVDGDRRRDGSAADTSDGSDARASTSASTARPPAPPRPTTRAAPVGRPTARHPPRAATAGPAASGPHPLRIPPVLSGLGPSGPASGVVAPPTTPVVPAPSTSPAPAPDGPTASPRTAPAAGLPTPALSGNGATTGGAEHRTAVARTAEARRRPTATPPSGDSPTTDASRTGSATPESARTDDDSTTTGSTTSRRSTGPRRPRSTDSGSRLERRRLCTGTPPRRRTPTGRASDDAGIDVRAARGQQQFGQQQSADSSSPTTAQFRQQQFETPAFGRAASSDSSRPDERRGLVLEPEPLPIGRCVATRPAVCDSSPRGRETRGEPGARDTGARPARRRGRGRLHELECPCPCRRTRTTATAAPC